VNPFVPKPPLAIVTPMSFRLTVQAGDTAVELVGIDAALKFAKEREKAYTSSRDAAKLRAIELGKVLLPVRRFLSDNVRYGRMLQAHNIDQKQARRAVRLAEEVEAGNAAVVNAPTLHQAELAAGLRKPFGPIGPNATHATHVDAEESGAFGPIGPNEVPCGTLPEPDAALQLRETLDSMDDEEVVAFVTGEGIDAAGLAQVGYRVEGDAVVRGLEEHGPPAAAVLEKGAAAGIPPQDDSGLGGSATTPECPAGGGSEFVARGAVTGEGIDAMPGLPPPAPPLKAEAGRAVQLTMGALYEQAQRVRHVAARMEKGELAPDVVARLMAAVDLAEGRAA